MEGKPGIQRKIYVKPQVTRVDLIEDEVALAACKRSTISSHTTPNRGSTKCNTNTCKLQANS